MKDNLFVLGVCGKARSGKDTAAALLTQNLGSLYDNRVRSFSLATPIKYMLEELLSYAGVETPTKYTDGDYKEMPISDLDYISAREMLQTLGTEWGKGHVCRDLWMRLLLANAKAEPCFQNGMFSVVVIPDIRFDDEAEECDLVVEITRSELPAIAEHVSEKGIKDSYKDFTITNNGTIGDLYNSLADVVNRVLEEEERYYERTIDRTRDTASAS